MATLTTPVYLEDAARTAGEAMTINGGSLTIRTDSRWHANSPASMTGSLGSVNISATLGGSYVLDGRNVRWLPYDGGSGNVPAVGTTITGGTSGANGYLLGVWASLTSAPTAVGAAMPASGFIKLREADAAYVDNDALTGIGATTSGVDVVGWIEVVHNQAAALTVPRLGNFTVRGDWFELGTTSGAANQLMQAPTNGSATAYVPGVWVETGVASGVYEFWPSLFAAGMITANLGTDERSKFVCMETDGQIRFGHNGTTTVGMVPASGLRVRIPNVLGRQCATGTQATNAIPHPTVGTRPEFVTTSAGAIDVENFATDWYFNLAQAYSVKLHHTAVFETIIISECASALDLFDGGHGCSASLDLIQLNLTSNFAGGTIEKWKAQRYSAGSNDHAINISYCIGQTFTNCDAGIIAFARSSGRAIQVTQSTGIDFASCRLYNQGITFTTSFDCTVNDLDYCDRYVGATTTAGVYLGVVTASSQNIVFDGVTFGLGGTIANVHPYTGVFNVALSVNCKFRNLGSRAAFLSGGSANNPAYIFVSGGNNQNLKFQRIYMSPTRTGAINTLNSDKGNLYEHVYGDIADTMTVASLNSRVRGCGGTPTTAGQISVYGTHFRDSFLSDTSGRVTVAMNEPTAETAGLVTVVSGTPKFTSAGGLTMKTVGDEIIIEQDYFTKGCVSLPNAAPGLYGTNVTFVSGSRWGNHDIYYQIDVNDGGGWNGTWKNFNGTELSGESVDPALGFKVKMRFVCATAATNNLITYARFSTTSTASDQANNLYPLDTLNLTLTGLLSGSDVVVLAAGTETVRDSADSVASYTYTYETPESIDIAVYKAGYIPFFIRSYALGSADASLPVAQVVDRAYLA